MTIVLWLVIRTSHQPTVIRPVQQSLALSFPTREIATIAVIFYLRDVPLHREPPTNLTIIFLRHSSPPVVATVPLEPPAWIGEMYPSFLAPDGERLAGVHAEKIE